MPQGGGLRTGDRDSDPGVSVYRRSRVACTAKRNANTPHVLISVDLRHRGGGDTDVAHCEIIRVVSLRVRVERRLVCRLRWPSRLRMVARLTLALTSSVAWD